jgi:hypothetical protein
MRRSKIVILLSAFALLIYVIYWVHSVIEEYHAADDPMLFKLKEILEDVHPSIADCKLYRDTKSYTLNKEKIFMCLYDEHGKYYPTNHLIYVFLHELAHALNKKDIGHTEKFYDVFYNLLDKAEKIGVYDPSIPTVQDYCMF